MIKMEYYKTRNDGVALYKTYSNNNKYIKQVETNRYYTEAIDVYPLKYTYVETEYDLSVSIETIRKNEFKSKLALLKNKGKEV